MPKILDILPDLDTKLRDTIYAIFGDDFIVSSLTTSATGVEVQLKIDEEILPDDPVGAATVTTQTKESLFRKRIHLEGLLTEILRDWIVDKHDDSSARYKVSIFVL